jgi:benzoylformate decarboxylase
MATVRDATYELVRDLGLTTWFGNPGSTEIPLLADFPSDLRYVLCLHEAAAVAAAAGYALGSGRPTMVSLHTTAGLGNGVSAIATARVNRAPLVVLVGQQDRRHLMAEPFLTGELTGLAGDYPLEVFSPPRAQDVPTCIAQACHVAASRKGPAVVIAPMDDWGAEMDDTSLCAPTTVAAATGVRPSDVAAAVELITQAQSPAIVTGAGADDAETWAALVGLAEKLDCPVFHEPFTARAGFPQDSERFAGFLPAARGALRSTLSRYDAVVVVGAALLRQYHFEAGPFLEPATRVVVISEDLAEVQRSPADIGLLAPPAAATRAIADAVAPRRADFPSTGLAEQARERMRSAIGDDISPEALFTRIALQAPDDLIVVEESPSSRDALQLLVPTRKPLGFLSAAMGGLGFGIPAAIGIRMSRPDRPVIAVIGDGSSIYCIQALWTAARYGVGLIVFVMGNQRYEVMERLTAQRGKSPWPPLDGISIAGLATAFGVVARTVSTVDEIDALTAELLPSLADRSEPLVVYVDLGGAR